MPLAGEAAAGKMSVLEGHQAKPFPGLAAGSVRGLTEPESRMNPLKGAACAVLDTFPQTSSRSKSFQSAGVALFNQPEWRLALAVGRNFKEQTFFPFSTAIFRATAAPRRLRASTHLDTVRVTS